jgi:hypothetical protein
MRARGVRTVKNATADFLAECSTISTNFQRFFVARCMEKASNFFAG